MQTLLQDIRYGSRFLLRNPGFAFIALCTLALGIGANSAIFSVVDTALLRQLPFRDPDRLMALWDQYPRALGTERIPASLPNFKDWKTSNHVFSEMGLFWAGRMNVKAGEEPEQTGVASVTDGFFSTLGVQPLLGRIFSAEEGSSSVTRGAVLAFGYWQRRLSGRVDVMGQGITIEGNPYTVIGVMPPDFKLVYKFANFNVTPEVWILFTPELHKLVEPGRGNHAFAAVARLKPGISREQAQAEMNIIAEAMDKQYPECVGFRTLVLPLHESIAGHLRPTLFPLLAAGGFVLLIACANVANLILARATGRERELAIRAALGAGRARIVRQLLTESMLLASAGGAVGLLIAAWGCSSINWFLREASLGVPPSQIDGRVLAFTILVSLSTGMVFGLVPALESAWLDLNSMLKEGGRSGSAGRSHRHLKNLLVVSEVALSLVLLTGAGLLIKSFVRLWQTNFGFHEENVLTLAVSLSGSHYPDSAKRIAFLRQLLDRVTTLPGVDAAAVASNLPTDGGWVWAFAIEGRPNPAPGQEPNETVQFVTPGYFRTLGVPLRRGRLFDGHDTEQSPPVVMINDALARKYWNDRDPLGERIQVFGTPRTIVGIVGDTRQDGLAVEPKPQIYFCSFQLLLGPSNLIIRTIADPLNLVAAVRQQVRALDNTLAVADIRTLEMVLTRNLSRQRLVMSLMGIFAVLALLLAMIGVYGVMAHSVSQRQQEIGIRMALGANSSDVLTMVLRQGMSLVLAGLALGSVAALGLTRLLTSQLFGVSPVDPLISAGVAILMIFVSLLASILPARRAARMDPLVALRYE
jgi:putative ABC transport system permease protein